MQQYYLTILVFLCVMCLGGAVLMWRRRPAPRGLEGTPSRVERPQAGLGSVLSSLAARLATGRPSARLREQLAQAGYHASNAAAVYLGTKMILLGSGLVLGIVVATFLRRRLPITTQVMIAAIAAIGMSFLPNLAVHMRRRSRQYEVRCHLPDALDLLEVCVSAGMGTDMAWNAVTDEMRRVSSILADEMALANLEIHLGAHRAEAMRHMAERTGEEDLNALAAILVQSERLGTSIADALQAFSVSMRETRKYRAQEAAESVAVKLLIPMIFFIFPAILIVLLGPAGMRIVDVFSNW